MKLTYFNGLKTLTDAWDDNEIICLTESSIYLSESEDSLVKISDDTVVKLGHTFSSACSDAFATDLIRTCTSIPVPRIRRVIHWHLHDEGDGLIVMDLIRNSGQLHVCRPSLSIWMNLKVILMMRSYFQQLRRIDASYSSMPGPPDPQPAVCNGLQFVFDSKGLFPTPMALADYFNTELKLAEERGSRGYGPPPGCKPLNESITLVLTHNNLSMRNILLDSNGQIWIADWNWAGFYSTWFEYDFPPRTTTSPLGGNRQ